MIDPERIKKMEALTDQLIEEMVGYENRDDLGPVIKLENDEVMAMSGYASAVMIERSNYPPEAVDSFARAVMLDPKRYQVFMTMLKLVYGIGVLRARAERIG